MGKEMETKNNHLILTFLMPSFHRRRKSEQQSRMIAADNIKTAQKKQKRDYDSRHMSKTEIKVDDIVLLKNKRFDWKGGKFSQKWLNPYTVMNVSDKGVATLKNGLGVTLKNKYNIV